MNMVILGRDGVINEYSDNFIKSPAEWHAISGSLQAIASLNQAGYQVVITTNQSGLARGLFDIDTLNAIHRKLYDQLDRVGGHLDGIFFCPHRPSDNCKCRKPKPGMLEQVARRFHVDLASTLVIGDSMQDLDAAQAAGASPMLVLTGRGEATSQRLPSDTAIPRFTDLARAARHILSEA